MDYDVILTHPPAIYDFREKAIFPGPIAYTVGGSTEQFITPSVGMLSIADYLDRHGYSVRAAFGGIAGKIDAGFSKLPPLRLAGVTSARHGAVSGGWCSRPDHSIAALLEATSGPEPLFGAAGQ